MATIRRSCLKTMIVVTTTMLGIMAICMMSLLVFGKTRFRQTHEVARQRS